MCNQNALAGFRWVVWSLTMTTTPVGSGAARTSGSGPRYTYQTLSEAVQQLRQKIEKEGKENVRITANIYARVLECSESRPTKRDYMCNVTVTDPPSAAGHYEDAEVCDLLCFCADPQLLPKTNKPSGDIIRLHRVQLSLWNANPQLVGSLRVPGVSRMSGPAPPFAYLLFDADPKAPPTSSNTAPPPLEQPYASGPGKNYTLASEDAAWLARMRNGGGGPGSDAAPAPAAPLVVAPSPHERTFSALSPHEKFSIDVRVKVLLKRGPFLYVWDGTVAPQLDLQTDDSPDLVASGLTDDLLERFELKPDLLLALDPNTPEAKVGTIVAVRVPPQMAREAASVPVGAWVALRNISRAVITGLFALFWTQDTRWSAIDPPTHAPTLPTLPTTNPAANPAAACLPPPWLPPSIAHGRPSLTTTLHPQQPFASLRDVRVKAKLGVVGKHRVLARVVGFFPTRIERFVVRQGAKRRHTETETQINGSGTIGGNGEGGGEGGEGRGGEGRGGGEGPSTVAGPRFYLRLRLEDPTGDLDVILSGPVAEAVLGMTAQEAAADANALARRFYPLCGYDEEEVEGGPPPPIEWLDLCIFSYYRRVTVK